MIKIGGIYFPEELFDAAKDGRLVIFAGAGISMGSPTNLPDFKKLAEQIASGTGLTKEVEEAEDQFLGRLQHQNIHVKERAADILNKSALQPNSLHENLCRLFSSIDQIKIVTTNYDCMLEKAAQKIFHDIPKVYAAPALPSVDNFTGIVHIHGSIASSKNINHIVLTDKDFGEAYLSEGYACRFILDLFKKQNSVILFIGYSYHDVVVKYLTRGMSGHQIGQKFILIGEQNHTPWDNLGIIPIVYKRENNFKELYIGIAGLAERVQRTMIEWKHRLRILCSHSLSDNQEETDEVMQAVYDPVKIHFFTQYAKDISWLIWMDQQKLLDHLFNKNMVLTQCDQELCQWIVSTFIPNNSENIFTLIISHNNTINSAFVEQIIYSLSKSNVSDTIRCRWICFLMDKVQDNISINRMIYSIIKDDNYLDIIFLLFEKLLAQKINIERKFSFLQDKQGLLNCKDIDIQIVLHDDLELDKWWGYFILQHIDYYAFKIIDLVSINIDYRETILKTWENNAKIQGTLLFEASYLELNKNTIEVGDSLSQIFGIMLFQSLKSMAHINIFYLQGWIQTHIEDSSLLYKKCAVALLQYSAFNADEQAEIIIQKVGLFDDFFHREIFLWAKVIFQQCSMSMKIKILHVIIEQQDDYAVTEEEQTKLAYEKYNWLVWLCSIDQHNLKLQEAFDGLQKNYPNFNPEKHPEGELEAIDTVLQGEISPWSANQLSHFNVEEVYSQMKSFQGKKIGEGSTRSGLKIAIAQCCADHFNWTVQLIVELKKDCNWESDLWEVVFQGLSRRTLTYQEFETILREISNENIIQNQVHWISSWMEYAVSENHVPDMRVETIDKAFKITQMLWKNHEKDIFMLKGNIDYATKMINAADGLIPLTWIKLIIKCFNMQKDRSALFEYLDIICLAWEKEKSPEMICAFTKYLGLIDWLDTEWCMKELIPLFVSDKEEDFNAAWGGFLLGGRLTANIVQSLHDVYPKAAAKIDEQHRHRFLRYYALNIIYSTKSPIENDLPIYFNQLKIEERKIFSDEIRRYLEQAREDDVDDIWDRWLCKYWSNRNQGIPKPLNDKEILSMIQWLPHLHKHYPEGVQLLTHGKLISFSGYILKQMSTNPILFQYQAATVEFLDYLSRCTLQGRGYIEYIADIMKKLTDVDHVILEKIKDQFMEKGIDLE